MPKAKNKSSKSKKGLLSRIDLRSSRVRLIAAVLVTAMIGGYFTYKSFADIGALSSWVPNNLDCYAGTDCKKTTDTDASKNNIPVLSVGPNASFLLPSAFLEQSKQYQMCVTAKGSGYLSFAVDAPSTYLIGVNIQDNTTYKEYCSGFATLNTRATNKDSLKATFTKNQGDIGRANISKIDIRTKPTK